MLPETILSVDGDEAERLIPKIRSVVETYKFRAYGDYQPWPGPNSNTFVQAALDVIPELNALLPLQLERIIRTTAHGTVSLRREREFSST
jgi:hypothetical protein